MKVITVDNLVEMLCDELLMKKEHGLSLVYRGKADGSSNTHGSCCNCPDCGYDHDNCVCEHNWWVKWIMEHAIEGVIAVKEIEIVDTMADIKKILINFQPYTIHQALDVITINFYEVDSQDKVNNIKDRIKDIQNRINSAVLVDYGITNMPLWKE